jgi:thiosulfate/3-mercaptopyruvate sulfurtransferase
VSTFANASRAFSLRSKYLIETEELSQLLKSKDSAFVKVVNSTWYMPNDERNAKKEHRAERITSNTVYFNIDDVVDPDSNLPHTMPSLEVFSDHMRKIDIPSDRPIICYDNIGIFSSPRVAWMLRYFGATNVRILNGGLKKWKAEGRSTSKSAPRASMASSRDGTEWTN